MAEIRVPIAAVLDRDYIALAAGTDQGVHFGMVVHVGEIRIEDPVTKEYLGTIGRREFVVVQATRVAALCREYHYYEPRLVPRVGEEAVVDSKAELTRDEIPWDWDRMPRYIIRDAR